MVITGNIFDESGYSPYWSFANRPYIVPNGKALPLFEPQEHQEKTSMNYSTAVIIINPSIRAVRGLYEENGNPDVFKTLDPDIKVGDFAVVESYTRWNMTTVKVTEVDTTVDFDSPKEVKWIIAKVDMASHENIKKMETQAIEVIKKGEMRKRREDIKKNTLDAVANGEIDKLDIMKLSSNILPGSTQQSS